MTSPFLANEPYS